MAEAISAVKTDVRCTSFLRLGFPGLDCSARASLESAADATASTMAALLSKCR